MFALFNPIRSRVMRRFKEKIAAAEKDYSEKVEVLWRRYAQEKEDLADEIASKLISF